MATETLTSSASTHTISLQASEPAENNVLNWNVADSAKPSSLHKIPEFTDKYAERQWAKEHMAAAFRTFARLGWADGASGHISLRDPVDPELFWINPYAKHFALMKASDLVLIDHAGKPMEATTHQVNAAGFIIHSSIHQARPDLNAVAHMHSPYGRAWSCFGRGLEMLNQDSCMFYRGLKVYEGFGGVVLAREEGQRIANALGSSGKNLILQNHGLLTAGATVDEAAASFIALERACQAQLLAEGGAANGIPKKLVGEEEALYSYRVSGYPACMHWQFMPEFDLTVHLSGGEVLK
ncbi:hypothetical protein LTR56_014706 [Elasticomyces elasticus]|nr:hypothetical protein LTR56_014706 [Elasticomyces elasticus]KAK3645496.1 hypothetical protein LTR22_014758 [Elasticomyces elasticus]KAK4915851.1 hypothetical protein LTR49_016109 [Elasticomyces elasticus]KAK5755552.1 hypothetical protein LTS12_014308 [Elasticomyces elasticus]